MLYDEVIKKVSVETRGNYKDGELHGLFEYFDKDGNLTKTVTYENGELLE